MEFRLSKPDVFPPGTEVEVHRERDWRPGATGGAVETAVVGDDRAATFLLLAVDTKYVACGGGRSIVFWGPASPGPTGEGTPGPQGPPGPPGADGAPGPKGDTGAKGADGAQGPKGDTGAAGAQGPKGDTGSQGPQGVKGDTGLQGPKGDTGAQGIQGPKGDTGSAGAQGPAGPSGGRLSISLRPSTGTAVAWTNMPAALTEFAGNGAGVYRSRADLAGATEARLTCWQTIAGATNAVLRVQTSPDGGTWTDLCTVAVGAGTGMKVGAWATIAAGQRIDAHLRLVGASGDAVADPAWNWVLLEAR